MSFSEILHDCLKICDVLQKPILTIYNNKNLFTTKSDNSAVCVADILVQTFLKIYLADIVETFIGEESGQYNFETHVTDLGSAVYVSDNVLKDDINKAHEAILEIIQKKPYKRINGLLAFIDPIDGTSEFTKQKGNESTICIGFAKDGKSYAGLIYRIIPNNGISEYAIGCKNEGLYLSKLSDNSNISDKQQRILTSNSSISSFLKELIAYGYIQVCSGGCGNKCLLLLENGGDIYIQDRGLSRWDTCAAQAILEAQGGVLCKLDKFIEDGVISSYQYSVSEINTDPNPLACFSSMNSNNLLYGSIGVQCDLVKPYSNLCGLLAIPCRIYMNEESMVQLKKAIMSVIRPSYN